MENFYAHIARRQQAFSYTPPGNHTTFNALPFTDLANFGNFISGTATFNPTSGGHPPLLYRFNVFHNTATDSFVINFKEPPNAVVVANFRFIRNADNNHTPVASTIPQTLHEHLPHAFIMGTPPITPTPNGADTAAALLPPVAPQAPDLSGGDSNFYLGSSTDESENENDAHYNDSGGED